MYHEFETTGRQIQKLNEAINACAAGDLPMSVQDDLSAARQTLEAKTWFRMSGVSPSHTVPLVYRVRVEENGVIVVRYTDDWERPDSRAHWGKSGELDWPVKFPEQLCTGFQDFKTRIDMAKQERRDALTARVVAAFQPPPAPPANEEEEKRPVFFTREEMRVVWHRLNMSSTRFRETGYGRERHPMALSQDARHVHQCWYKVDKMLAEMDRAADSKEIA